jgi:alcohol dehydrogenase (cytochrome c)
MGLGGKSRVPVGDLDNFLSAIDYRTGKAAWKHRYPGAGSAAGMLVTAGGVLFTGDGSGNFVAFDAGKGRILWHTRIGNITNAPQTYLVDGKQHVLVAVNDMLYAFRMY